MHFKLNLQQFEIHRNKSTLEVPRTELEISRKLPALDLFYCSYW
jgi:hypothetical protein